MEIPDLGSSLVDVALRTGIIYVFIVVALRVGGQRDVGHMSKLDLIVLLVIADAVQNAMVGQNSTLLGGIVAAAVLIGLDRGLRFVEHRWKPAERFIEGEPRMLIRDGRVLGKALRDEDIATEELMSALREHGLERPDQVKLAVLETDGSVSVVPFAGEDGPD